LKKIISDIRPAVVLPLLLLMACNGNEPIKTPGEIDSLQPVPETVQVKKQTAPETPLPETYANKRFRDVTVERVGRDSFLIRGQGQIFEANFNWIVEDGHEELKRGFQMTDAGAPEWGKFEFGITAHKKRERSTLTLILFEISAMDGSRQYELPIPLY
jgi:hypothetical protein